MTELEIVESAKCPHCRESVSSDSLKAMMTSDEAVLVCPECDTILGGAMGDGMFIGIVATLLAEDVDELETVGDAVAEGLEADHLSDVDDETLEILNERMGSPELSTD